MTAEDGPAEDEAAHARQRVDALRRRLYGPTATEADRAEYAALVERFERPQPAPADPEREPAADEQEQPPTAVPVRRRSARPVVIGVAGAVVVAALAVVATQAARSVSTPPTAPTTPAWLSSATAAPAPTSAVLTDGGRRLAGQQTSGGGSAVVRLDVSAAPRNGGRLVVALTSSDPSPVGWLAERPRGGSSRTGSEEVVASSPPAVLGAAAPTTVAYSGAPPSLLLVQAPTGTGWIVTVAFTAATATPA